MHSLAFGSLVPFISDDPKGAVDRKKMEMTQDVMANSLVYWVQDLYRGGFLGKGSKIYAMTSEGSTRVVPSYGVVSSARRRPSNRTSASSRWSSAGCGLRDHRQRHPRRGHDDARAHEDPRARHDHRLGHGAEPDRPDDDDQDVANAIVALSGEGTGFISGEVIGVDGGEYVTGS